MKTMTECGWDAHNHLQLIDPESRREAWLAEAKGAGVSRMVVNGTCEADWDEVAHLADRHAEVVPSFGVHPWRLSRRSPRWMEALRERLTAYPVVGVGEIGIDAWILGQSSESLRRWGGRRGAIEPVPMTAQIDAFLAQWNLAVDLALPVTVHCIQAWGKLLELLRAAPRAPRGFLLHSFGGPLELVNAFADLGAYFGFSGALTLPKRQRQLEVMRVVPLDRLLMETDSPDQLPSAEWITHPVATEAGMTALNHPANLVAIQRFAAAQRGTDPAEFSKRMRENASTWFGVDAVSTPATHGLQPAAGE
jgi:TatD DNase family protein